MQNTDTLPIHTCWWDCQVNTCVSGLRKMANGTVHLWREQTSLLSFPVDGWLQGAFLPAADESGFMSGQGPESGHRRVWMHSIIPCLLSSQHGHCNDWALTGLETGSFHRNLDPRDKGLACFCFFIVIVSIEYTAVCFWQPPGVLFQMKKSV